MSNTPSIVFLPGFPGTEIMDAASDAGVPSRSRRFPPSLSLVLSLGDRWATSLLPTSDDSASERYPSGPPIEYVFEQGRQLRMGSAARTLYKLFQRELHLPIDDPRRLARFGWDWRHRVDCSETRARLIRVLQSMNREHGIIIVCHSTGGLVVRDLLERQGALSNELIASIRCVIGLGVPWAGTLRTMEVIEKGESGLFGLLWSADAARELVGNSWASYDLLPISGGNNATDVFGIPLDFVTVRGTPSALGTDPLATRWAPSIDRRFKRNGVPYLRAVERLQDSRLRRGATGPDPLGAFSRIPLYNFVGWGLPTTTRADLEASGLVRQFTKSLHGDGTIPRASAAWLRGDNVTTLSAPLGVDESGKEYAHSQLWNSLLVKEALKRIVLQQSNQSPLIHWAISPPQVVGDHRVLVRIAAYNNDLTPLSGAMCWVQGRTGLLGPYSVNAVDGRCDFEVPHQEWKQVSGGFASVELVVKQGATELLRSKIRFLRA